MREYDVVVVGSGFGGAVAALRLAEKGHRVAVLEEGRRFEPQDFPKTSWRVRDYLWAPRLGCRGIQRITPLRDVLVLSGAGVGGGSLVGVTRFSGDTPADRVLRGTADRLGVGDTFEPTPVGVWFGEDGVDPYFGGAGPLRNGCDLRGACMTGCRRGAKNSLDLNYLWLAEGLGAEIHADTRVERIRASNSLLQGRWELETSAGPIAARDVVLAAGVLGTIGILFRSGLGGPRVGDDVRTNSEVIVGASANRADVDYSRGLAITSMIRADVDTHIQPVRYGRGSNLMGLLGTILVDEAGVNEVLLGTPTTAHILGGACVDAVCDRYHRMLDALGLHVVDGSAVNANLGVNPSLTIAAQAERAFALWPNAGEEDRRPPLGAPYRKLEWIAPSGPAVPAGAPAAWAAKPRSA